MTAFLVSDASAAQAVIDGVAAGDSIDFADGTYNARFLVSGKTGTSGLPILLRAVNHGQAIIDGQDTRNQCVLVCGDSSYINIQGFAFKRALSFSVHLNGAYPGAGVNGQADNCIVTSCISTDTDGDPLASAIFVAGNNNAIRYCDLSGASEHAVYLGGNNDGSIVEYNNLHDNAKTGCRYEGTNITIRYNTIAGNSWHALSLYTNAPPLNQTDTVNIYGNTLSGSGICNLMFDTVENTATPRNIYVRDNMVDGTGVPYNLRVCMRTSPELRAGILIYNDNRGEYARIREGKVDSSWRHRNTIFGTAANADIIPGFGYALKR